jgi:hypothetical protein
LGLARLSAQLSARLRVDSTIGLGLDFGGIASALSSTLVPAFAFDVSLGAHYLLTRELELGLVMGCTQERFSWAAAAGGENFSQAFVASAQIALSTRF